MVPHRMLIGYTTECSGTSKSFRSHDSVIFGIQLPHMVKCTVVYTNVMSLLCCTSLISKSHRCCVWSDNNTVIFSLYYRLIYSVFAYSIYWQPGQRQEHCFVLVTFWMRLHTYLVSKPYISVHCNYLVTDSVPFLPEPQPLCIYANVTLYLSD